MLPQLGPHAPLQKLLLQAQAQWPECPQQEVQLEVDQDARVPIPMGRRKRYTSLPESPGLSQNFWNPLESPHPRPSQESSRISQSPRIPPHTHTKPSRIF